MIHEESPMTRDPEFNRRRFLRGAGALVALPLMESLPGLRGVAQAAIKSGSPKRAAFVYVPNGVIQTPWWPTGDEKAFSLSTTMEPLEALRGQIQIFQGLDHANATAGPDGAGDHARANGTFLTGVRVKKTAGGDIRAGVSIDQVIARHVGQDTRFPSLELSCDGVRKSGNCDSGYSCAYQFNLSWTGPTSPLAPEPNPRLAFERLFGGGPIGERRKNYKLRQEQQRSVLDFVRDDAKRLQAELSGRDRQKLDQYLNGVRELEMRIEKAERTGETPDPNVPTPPGIPANYQEHIRLMFTVLQLAFQTDSTRVATFLMAHDGSNRSFADIGVPEGHHDLSHHGNDAEKMAKIAEIDRFYTTQLAWFLDRMAQTKDVDGRSLLDNSMIVYGSGNADGNRHSHHNLPVLLAGGGGGTLNGGRFVKAGSVPLSNLFLSVADRMGVPNLDRFGDSTGRFTNV